MKYEIHERVGVLCSTMLDFPFRYMIFGFVYILRIVYWSIIHMSNYSKVKKHQNINEIQMPLHFNSVVSRVIESVSTQWTGRRPSNWRKSEKALLKWKQQKQNVSIWNVLCTTRIIGAINLNQTDDNNLKEKRATMIKIFHSFHREMPCEPLNHLIVSIYIAMAGRASDERNKKKTKAKTNKLPGGNHWPFGER